MTDVLISIEIARASGDGVIRLNGSSVGGTGVTVGGSDRQPATASVSPRRNGRQCERNKARSESGPCQLIHLTLLL